MSARTASRGDADEKEAAEFSFFARIIALVDKIMIWFDRLAGANLMWLAHAMADLITRSLAAVAEGLNYFGLRLGFCCVEVFAERFHLSPIFPAALGRRRAAVPSE
jgi:hypothetical protein